MTNLDDENGMAIQYRTAEYKPPRSWRTWLIGRPLQTADAPHQTIGKFIGLAVFSSDAISSTAYGPQEMMMVLAAVGTGALGLSIPISIAIVILLAILTLSYQQTIHAYPGGGGAYIVARDNLGELPALTAGAALLTDYVLTVAVSVSSGVAQIVSAFPVLFPNRVLISVALVLFIMVINMRGVRESGIVFAFPTYFFLLMMFLTVGVGLFRSITGTLGSVVDPPILQIGTVQALTAFLILRSFANGTTALTGVEAISNGITAFKEPRSDNAAKTLVWMAGILGSSLLGITILSTRIGAIPSEVETVISQTARTVFDGRGLLYLAMIAGTTVILIMAANTSFADFPRLSALVSADGFLPRQFTYRGSRLVYSTGIGALALIACLLIVIFQASVTALIPLYAIGVFLSFTLSQSGMAHRWWKSGHMLPGKVIKERGSTLSHNHTWLIKMIINGFGAVCTAVVTLVFAITKFGEGAYVVIILVPTMVAIFYLINRHYAGLAGHLSLDNFEPHPPISRHRVILAISGVHQGTLAALRYARTLSDDITAVHVSIDNAEAEKIKRKWEVWGEGIRLVILDSPYRLFLEPMLQYIEDLDEQRKPNEIITIVVPQFIPRHWWVNYLHTRTADALRSALFFKKDIVITDVPYQVT
jgi:amino acid transporter